MMPLKHNLFYSLILSLCFVLPLQAGDNSEALLELFQRIDRLDQEIRTLRGENEHLQHTLGKLKKAQKEGFLGTDERIDHLSKRVKLATKVPTAKADTKPEKPTPPAQKENPKKAEKPNIEPAKKAEKPPTSKLRSTTVEEKTAYNQAYKKINDKPIIAIQAFRNYIKKYPKSTLAANAQYWIGEVMYSEKNYSSAVDEFVKVLQNYRKSNKASDAAIKLGFSFYELKNWVYARRALEDVKRYFPKTKAAALATQRIAKMKADGQY